MVPFTACLHLTSLRLKVLFVCLLFVIFVCLFWQKTLSRFWSFERNVHSRWDILWLLTTPFGGLTQWLTHRLPVLGTECGRGGALHPHEASVPQCEFSQSSPKYEDSISLPQYLGEWNTLTFWYIRTSVCIFICLYAYAFKMGTHYLSPSV